MTMADWVLEVLRNAPLVSAAAWLLLAALQVYRDRWHTWTETFFLFSCAFAGIYAIGDWLFFNAPPNDPSLAGLYARISLTGITLAVNFFLLFTLVYVDRMRQSYWILMLITGGVLLMMLTIGIDHVTPPPPNSGALYLPSFSEVPFAIYLVYVLIYTVAGIRNLYRLRQIVRESSPALTRRATGLMVTFTLVLVLGLGTNGYLGIARNGDIPPPLSTLLIFVAGSAYYTLFPVGRERISEAIRRFQAQRYSIKAAFITFEDGTLIGAKIRPGEKVIDQDLFGATLDVIQSYMKTSVPILRGKSLSSITHGHYVLVLERARFTYLTVVLEGEETDQLRRQMRDLLLGFESNNRQVLAAWQGIPEEAKGTEDVFTGIFVESPVA
jgi:hypothetical protein